MKWLLIAAFCISAASATTLVGGKPCTWGPAYWCQGLENAKKCSAVSHCATKVWKQEPATEVGSTESCLICKGIVKDLQTLLAAKKSQDEIKALGLKACSLLHNEKQAQEVCNTVVIMFLPEVIQMIESEVDATKICGLLHLCDKSKIATKFSHLAKLLNVIKQQKVSSASCEDCKMAVKMAKSYLSQNDTQMEVMQFLNNEVCIRLPGDFGLVCKKMVAEILPQVFQNLDQILDPATICGMLGMCPKKIGQSVVHKVIKRIIGTHLRANAIECELCKTGITDIRNQLRDAAVQKEVQDFLNNEVCSRLGSLTVECQQGLEQYLPVAFQFLVNELDPDTTCKALHLCSAASHSARLSLLAAKTVAMRQPRAGPQCVLCEFLMSKVDSLLGDNRTEAAIESALEKVCSVLPQTIRAECDNFVEKYGPVVIKLLASELSPAVVCTALGMCTSVKNQKEVMCPQMMRYAHVLSQELRMSVENIVNKVCVFVPRRDRPACLKFVEEHKLALLKLDKTAFKTPFQPAELCKRIQSRPRPNGLVQLLGRSKCTYGPAYWCASQKNAEECGAMKHCEERVWKRASKVIF